MKTFLRTKTGRIASGTALLILALLLHSCAWRQPKPPSQGEYYDTNRPPVEAPASVKASDFRLNPPVVEDITVKKLTAGKELLAVRYAADPRLGRTVTMIPDQNPIVLHDDGLNGDAVAGDHVYSAILPSEWDSLAAEQDRVLAELEQRRAPVTVPVFRGREIVGKQTVDLEELRTLRKQDIIKVLPFGTGATVMTVGGVSAAAIINAETLFITDSNVVNDPTRTFNPFPPPGTPPGAPPVPLQGTPMGKWTFGYLMTQMANPGLTRVDPADFVLNWLNSMGVTQKVNGTTVPGRNIIAKIKEEWPKLKDNRLDLANAPVKLLAIVNRIDLAANSTYGPAGGAEGRFIFTFMETSSSGNPVPIQFTFILEYGVPRHSSSEIRDWARQWLNLTNFALGTPQYNDALWAITSQFTESNDVPANPNNPSGSALDQLRTDEFDLVADPAFNWELREFQILANNNQLNEVTVKQTPETYSNPGTLQGPVYYENGNLNGQLVQWINQNRSAIINGTDTVPGPFLGGSAPNFGAHGGQIFWSATANAKTPIYQEAARRNLSLNTCNGCHGAETATDFQQVIENEASENGPATLSGFLTGITLTVDLSGTELPGDITSNPTHSYNDLARRAQVLMEDASASGIIKVRVPVTLATH